jgi:uncharacterized membrane protein
MRDIDYWSLALYLALYLGYHVAYLVLPRNFGFFTREWRLGLIREAWFRSILRLGQPILAIQTVRNLIMVHSFFGSVTLLLLGGVFSYLFATFDLLEVLETGGYLTLIEEHAIVVKLLLSLLVVLVSALNFLMGLRVCFNLNFALGGVMEPEADISFQMEMVQRQARHLMVGVRSLYFSGPLLLWVLHPTLLVVTTVAITVLLFRFDFLKDRRRRQRDAP